MPSLPFLPACSLALLLACTLAVPASAQTPRLSLDFERFQLANGLDVVLHRDATVPSVSVNTWYHVGSGVERPGRTGFAHLFEHLMFEGSGHVPEGAIDSWIEEAGGSTNGSTWNDYTNYYTDGAANALDLALFLDADRMASLLDAMTPAVLDGQRAVVQNERRQSYENQPYGLAFPILEQYLHPEGHPYHHPGIGSMADLEAASFEDVTGFFRTYYTPNNASLVVAGDIELAEARRLVEKWYGSIPRGPEPPPLAVAPARRTAEARIYLEDRVELPRLHVAWLSPAEYAPGDAAMTALAAVLAEGKNSRLYKRLVYEMQIAQDVDAGQYGARLSGSFFVIATARPGHTLDEIEAVIHEEIARLQAEPPTLRELERVRNGYESAFLDGLERVGGFGGKADQFNRYLTFTGTPDFFEEDLARFRALSPQDLRDAATTWLRPTGRVVLSVVPEGEAAAAAAHSTLARNDY